MTRNRFLLHRIEALHDMLKIFISEMKIVFKDEGVIIFFFVVPLLYPLLYSWIYNNEVVTEVPAIMVDAAILRFPVNSLARLMPRAMSGYWGMPTV